MFEIGSGGLQSDHEVFGVDMENGEHRERTRESLDIILNLWEHVDGPFKYKGKFWDVNIPDPKDYEYADLRTHITPYQKPHPPIGVAGASPGSDTLKIVGERGYIPMSLGLNAVYVASHWDAVKEGAAASGKTPPSRREWRIVRDIWVAETDAEARESAINGMLGRAWKEYLHPLFSSGAYPFVSFLKHDESMSDDGVTLEYMLDNLWLVGSAETVTEKIRELYDTVGGFGHLLWLTFDHADNSEAYETSMRLLAQEVIPKLSELKGEYYGRSFICVFPQLLSNVVAQSKIPSRVHLDLTQKYQFSLYFNDRHKKKAPATRLPPKTAPNNMLANICLMENTGTRSTPLTSV